MMGEWNEYVFTEFVEINPKVSLKSGHPYPFVEMKDLSENRKYCLHSQIKELKGGSKFQNDDTLFARITPCLENGKICQVKGLIGGKGFGSTEFLIFRERENISNGDFIFYLSRWDEVRSFAEVNLEGTSGRQRVSKDAFSNLILELPPLPEQKAIAAVLSSLDDKIDLLHRQNKTLEAMGEVLFREWFVEGAEEDWEEGRIGDIGTIITGKTPSTKVAEYWGESIPFITPTDYKNYGKYTIGAIRHLSSLAVEKFDNLIIPKNSIIVTCIGSDMGKIAITNSSCITNQQINSIIFNKGFSSVQYVYYYLKHTYPHLRSIAMGGTTMPIINKTEFSNIDVPIPNQSLLNKFDNIVNSLSLKMNKNQAQIQTLEQLRDTLLPKLMSGEVRVRYE